MKKQGNINIASWNLAGLEIKDASENSDSYAGGNAMGSSACKKNSSKCEEEVIVQGDEGPVRGVAQVVDCHGVTVGHQEREEEEEQQEVESDGETLKDNHTCTWMG